MEMCRCFFKVLLKFKMAAMHELHIFLWAQKLKSNNVQVILLKFKMATTSRFFKYLLPQKLQPNLWRGMI